MDENNAVLVLKKLNNMPVTFEENTTGVQIETTYEELKDAIYELNKEFAIVGAAALNDFLMSFPQIVYPNELDESLLKSGWCCECMYYYDGPWIDYELRYKSDDESVIELRFTPQPCVSFYDCQGTEETCFQ